HFFTRCRSGSRPFSPKNNKPTIQAIDRNHHSFIQEAPAPLTIYETVWSPLISTTRPPLNHPPRERNRINLSSIVTTHLEITVSDSSNMTIYDTTAGENSNPSRNSRITLPPMMMQPQPQTHPRPLHYNTDVAQESYLRHPYISPPDYNYDYDLANSTNYEPTHPYPPNNQYQCSSHAVEMQDTQNNHSGNGPLSLSLLVAAAHAAQADMSYGQPSMHFNPTLPLSCGLGTSGAYSPALNSAETQGNWPPIGLTASDSDPLAASPPHTPLTTPDMMYDASMMPCGTSHNNGSHPVEPNWSMDRVGAEPPYTRKPSLPRLSHMGYSNHNIATTQYHSGQSPECPIQQPLPMAAPLHKAATANLSSRPVIKRTCKSRGTVPQPEDKDSSSQGDTSPDPETSPKAGKPKQGRKKRSVGYVRPIINHRKRVGQRLLDMLRSAPIPSKVPSMEVARARCFPFAEMRNKLKEWYGLQIEWPEEALFKMTELRSTRRMRLDELERLDKTLDGGEVRLRLSREVLEDEPHRAGEYSLPSEGYPQEHSSEYGATGCHPYQREEDSPQTSRRRRNRKM
ncbi:hypothetical protein PCASD_22465, partial [Puccinia coronata f. sp. avenae]